MTAVITCGAKCRELATSPVYSPFPPLPPSASAGWFAQIYGTDNRKGCFTSISEMASELNGLERGRNNTEDKVEVIKTPTVHNTATNQPHKSTQFFFVFHVVSAGIKEEVVDILLPNLRRFSPLRFVDIGFTSSCRCCCREIIIMVKSTLHFATKQAHLMKATKYRNVCELQIRKYMF